MRTSQHQSGQHLSTASLLQRMNTWNACCSSWTGPQAWKGMNEPRRSQLSPSSPVCALAWMLPGQSNDTVLGCLNHPHHPFLCPRCIWLAQFPSSGYVRMLVSVATGRRRVRGHSAAAKCRLSCGSRVDDAAALLLISKTSRSYLLHRFP